MTTYPNYKIVGCQTGRGPNGEIPLRLNVRDLYKNHKDKWALYILGLRIWYDKDPADALSYFQVAGIHGMPYVKWNGEEIRMNGKVPTGYCTHSTVLFPSWHRPYLVLFEQRLQQIMLEEIIPKIPGSSEQAKYKRAAEIFRIPYWDWASPPEGASEAQILEWLPPTCTEPVARNPIPGFDTEIPNPLYRFVLKGRDGKKTFGDYGVQELNVDATRVVDYEKCIGLSRCPENPYYEDQVELQVANQQNPDDVKTWQEDWPEKWREGEIRSRKVYDSFTSELGWLDQSIPRPQHGIAENIHRMFSYALNYVDFATNGGVPAKGEDLDRGQWFQSLEAIHNNIHWWVGGNYNGHMAQVPVASFDPFFWLHHANIERYYCMWQFLNPDKWFEDRTEIFTDATGVMLDKDGNVVQDEKQAARVTVGPTTPLAPFKNKDGQYYNSNQVRDHTTFNYTYPQLQTWNHPSRQVHVAALLKEINQKYGGHRKQTLGDKSEAQCLEVVVNVTFSKFLFQGYPFNINVYLQHGEQRNPKIDFIGQAYNFSAPAAEGGKEVCSNCTRLQGKDAKCSAQLVISQLLRYFKHYPGASNIDISNRDQVEQFLKEKLYVKIFATSGREIVPNNETQQVTVAVAYNQMRYNNNDSKLPEFGMFKNFASLAGDIAKLLVVAPGAFVLSGTGAVLGTLNDAGEVLVNGQLKNLEELNHLKLKSFEQTTQAAGQFISAVTNPLFGGTRKDDDNNKRGGGGLGGLGGGLFR